jgi:hypothetical protein
VIPLLKRILKYTIKRTEERRENIRQLKTKEEEKGIEGAQDSQLKIKRLSFELLSRTLRYMPMQKQRLSSGRKFAAKSGMRLIKIMLLLEKLSSGGLLPRDEFLSLLRREGSLGRKKMTENFLLYWMGGFLF